MTFETFLKPMRIHFQEAKRVLTIPDVLNSPYPMLKFEAPTDPRSLPVDCDAPYRVLFLCYEDLPIADNYRDLIITMNPVARWDKPTEHGHMVVVFFCEGSIEKWVCYSGRLVHHYDPKVPAQKYGIFATWDLPLKGPCPICSKTGTKRRTRP